ncbi:ATP-binding protein [Leifsonia sp. C5G2]|uniref:AAA family ATPase n=1 Tax=Leifsonia sp. C5G2 TaxID=2735269 RepID=UPI001C30B8CB
MIAPEVPGRTRQLADFEERLSYLVDLRRLDGRIHVDHAPRGFGKTSLLRNYQRRARNRGVLAVWVTAGEGHLIGQIAAELARETAAWSETARRKFGATLDSLTVRVGVPAVAGVEATVRPGAHAPAVPSMSREFESVIRVAAAGDKHTAVVLLIDEIQAADPDGLRTLAYAWQHLQSEGADVPAAVFAAGLPNSADVISGAATASERFAYRPLPALQPQDEELALIVPARLQGVEWRPEALALALDTARGYPYLVQLIGDAAWTAAGRPDPGAWIELPHVLAGREAMQDDMEALFRARWSNATDMERDFMTAMAQLGDGSVRRIDIAERLGVTSASLSVPRDRLLNRGFIQASRRGALEFTIPGFADYIRIHDDN